MRKTLFIFCILTLLTSQFSIPTPARASQEINECTRYVDVTGSDANDGLTTGTPWATLQKAANVSTPGVVICARGGVYPQRLTITRSGLAGAPVTFQSYPGETAVLDGGALTVPAAANGLVYVKGAAYIIFKGFELRNYRSAVQNIVPVGILISGLAHHVEIRNNQVHAIEHNGTLKDGTDAHGIAVYGRSGTQSIHDITIDGNELYNLKLGSSEALVLNGNVENWLVTNNLLHDLDNIGIDVIGFEGTAPANDQARNGVIGRNHIYNIDTYGNPAYGTDRSAACIYVDGGKQVTIQFNLAEYCNLGIEIASEHAGKATSYIMVRNNRFANNSEVGLAMGGYDTKRGATQYCTVVNNTFYNNNTSGDWGAELYIQYNTNNNIVWNNIFAAGSARQYIASWSAVMSNNQLDDNLFFSAGGVGGKWEWKGTTYTSFSAYRRASGNDAHSINGKDPLLSVDLHLQSGSPAIDSGLNTSKSGRIDIDSQPRIFNTRIDIGADEAQ